MIDKEVFESVDLLAAKAASISVSWLKEAVNSRGCAVWVLAGGTSPIASYRVISKQYRDELDWSKVYLLIGDERSVGIDDEESNWRVIKDALTGLPLDKGKVILPSYTSDNDRDAANYSEKVAALFEKLGSNVVDLLWLGMGEDGHTLSLFPGHKEILNEHDFVIAVNDSPKPPPKRITLGLKALADVGKCLVLTNGAAKNEVFGAIIKGDKSLPIARVTSYLGKNGAKVLWLVDSEVVS